MTRLKHQFLSTHKFSVIAIPATPLDQLKELELEQKDGSVVKVQLVPGKGFSFPINELPETLTLILFGLTIPQMQVLIRTKYPEFAALPINQQVVYYHTIQKL